MCGQHEELEHLLQLLIKIDSLQISGFWFTRMDICLSVLPISLCSFWKVIEKGDFRGEVMWLESFSY